MGTGICLVYISSSTGQGCSAVHINRGKVPAVSNLQGRGPPINTVRGSIDHSRIDEKDPIVESITNSTCSDRCVPYDDMFDIPDVE